MRSALLAVFICAVLAASTSALLAQDAAPATEPAAQPTSKLPPQPAPCILPTLRMLQPRAIGMLTERLKLNSEEQAKVLDLLTKSENALTPKIEAQRKAVREYTAALCREGATEAELTAAANAAMKAETDIMNDRIKTLVALRGVLTPEQNKSFTIFLDQSSVPWKLQPTAPPRPVLPGGPKPD